MANNEPILVEDKIQHALDGQTFGNVSNNLRYMLLAMYGAINDDEIVHCKKTEDFVKPDLVIEINGITKNLSVKTGRAENVHNEIIDNFIDFLRKEGISEETLDTIKLFHYGDGTTDGSGKERKAYLDVVTGLKDNIKHANEELNYRKDFVLKTMYHCFFQGVSISNPIIDAVYFGTKEYGIVATRKQILSHLRKRSFSFYDNLHIGPLLLRPHSRYVNRKIADERNRNRLIAYWPNLNADLSYISQRYDF